MASSVIGLVSDTVQAEALVNGLGLAGFGYYDISLLMPDATGVRDLSVEKHSKAPEGTATGAGTGAIVGGALGLLAGIGALAIPGLGPFIAAGPIMGCLSGAAVGGAVGGVAGGLIGMGIPEYEAKQYATKVSEGSILVSVHAENSKQADRAKDIFKGVGATDISVVNEAGVQRKAS